MSVINFSMRTSTVNFRREWKSILLVFIVTAIVTFGIVSAAYWLYESAVYHNPQQPVINKSRVL